MLPVPVMCLEGLSLVVYLLLIAFLLWTKNKALKSPFFLIFISTGVLDIVSYLDNTMELVIEATEVCSSAPMVVLSLNHIIRWYTLYGHLLGGLLTTANRFSSIVFSTRYNLIWDDRHTRFLLGAQWCLPVVLVIYRVGGVVVCDGAVPHIASPYTPITRCVAFTLCTTVSCTCLGLNYVTVSKFRVLKSEKKRERGLIVVALVAFACNMLMNAQIAIQFYALVTGDHALDGPIDTLWYYLNDLLIFSSPFSLLLFSATLRKELKYTFFPSQRTQSVVTTLSGPVLNASQRPSFKSPIVRVE